jgi:CheY-like chemotaxis protein
MLLVTPVTVREWARKGLIPSVSTAGGHRRFLLDDIRRFAAEHGIRLEPPAAARLGPAERLRIMLVDDDAVFSTYVREIVLGVEPNALIEQATDGFDAGQLSEKLRPQIIVIDINMPRMDGLELCRRLRMNPATATARLVVLSGVLSPENVSAVQAAGADMWLEKGASSAAILGAMQLPRASRPPGAGTAVK